MVLSNGNPGKDVTVSVVVLAFNEAKNLPKTIFAIHRAIDNRFSDYEIIIIDDGSHDKTGRVADQLARKDPRVLAVHNPGNMGCGYTFWHGVKIARYQYVWLIPGDGEIPQVSLKNIADAIGQADMIIPYMVNTSIRPVLRRVISRGYTSLLNALFFKRMRYYNGPAVFPTAQVRTAPEVHSRGFAFMAPIIIYLLKKKCTFLEVGIHLKQRDYGRPSVNNIRNILSALRTMTRYYLQLQFSRQSGRKG
jgi:glycosyltransferase involved in cell wall biosynthesis